MERRRRELDEQVTRMNVERLVKISRENTCRKISYMSENNME